MGDIHETLKKYLGKITKAITELTSVQSELQILLSNEQLPNKVEVNTKDEILKSVNATSKDYDSQNLASHADALEKMLNDDDMWLRRTAEHKKIVEYEQKQSQSIINKSNKENNLTDTLISPPVVPDKVEKLEPKINALTRLKLSDQSLVLYSLYLEAKKNVQSLEKKFNADEEELMIKNEADTLLQIWLKNH